MCAKKRKFRPMGLTLDLKLTPVKPSKTLGKTLKKGAEEIEKRRKKSEEDYEQDKFNKALIRALENPDCLRAIRNAVREERASHRYSLSNLIT